MATASTARPYVSATPLASPNPPSSSIQSQVTQPVSTSAAAQSQSCNISAPNSSIRFFEQVLSKIAAIVLFTAAVLGFVIVVWTKQSLDISDKSLKLAQWTAMKEFFEFCKNQEAPSQECNSTLEVALASPPLLKRLPGLNTGTWQTHTQIEDRSQHILHSLLFYALFMYTGALILFALVGLLKMIRRGRTIIHGTNTVQTLSLKAKVEILGKNVGHPLTRVYRPRTNGQDKGRCLTHEHDCHLQTLEMQSIMDSTVARSSSATMRGLDAAVLQKRAPRLQDRMIPFQVRAVSPENKSITPLRALLDSGADFALISRSAAIELWSAYGRL
jgi:hypothetical protein